MLNVCTIAGRIGNEPELKKTAKLGRIVCTIRLACERDSNRYSEENNVDWITCVFWEKNAETLAKYAEKGAMITVVGRLKMREYEDIKGIDRTTYEIDVHSFYFGEKKQSAKPAPGQGPEGEGLPVHRRYKKQKEQEKQQFTEEPDDGELPF